MPHHRTLAMILAMGLAAFILGCPTDEGGDPPADDDAADDDAADDDAADDDAGDDDAGDDDAGDDDSGDDDSGDDDTGDDDSGDDDSGGEPPPLFAQVDSFTTILDGSGDEADVYHPDPADLANGGYAFPVVLMFQGANVDKQYYSGFAEVVARYGFAVVVPNHWSSTMLGSGLYAEFSELDEVMDFLADEDGDPSSPLHDNLDLGTLLVAGHSYGGVCGLNIVAGNCQPPYCSGGFTKPAELKAGAFWGTNNAIPIINIVMPVNNGGTPMALIQGTADSMAPPNLGHDTYDAIADAPKLYAAVQGANHYGQCDVDNPPGAQADGTAPTLDQATSVETVGRWAALFFRAEALNDAAAHDYVHVTGSGLDPNVTAESVP